MGHSTTANGSYPQEIAREAHEGWRCENGVIDAGTRCECPCYLREVGADVEALVA